jgi:hypothetical protein
MIWIDCRGVHPLIIRRFVVEESTQRAGDCCTGRREVEDATACRWSAAGAARPDTLCHLTARSLFAGLADYELRDTEAQKRRSGLPGRVRPTPVGSISAHEEIVVGTMRAFFRPSTSSGRPEHRRGTRCESEAGPARSERAVWDLYAQIPHRQILHARTKPSNSDRNSPVR